MTDQKKEALEFIIRNRQIRTVFQPIISLHDGGILGYEALSRITCEGEIRDPDTMHDETFKRGFTKTILKQYGITPSNVIFEITERNVITDMSGFKAAINHYKSQNYKIAIDDAGAGYSGLNLISDIRPDYVKLDMKLIRDVDKGGLKYALIKGMVEFSKVAEVFLVAEGIETLEELGTLVDLGVQYGQGYFIQRPDPEVREIMPEVLNALR